MKTLNSTDADLVAATLGGSREAFGALVERHQQFVCALAYSKTGSVAASEDIAQEAFLSAWKNLPTLRARENFRGWLCGTVRNLAAKFHGRQKTAVPLTDDLSVAIAPSDEIMSREEEAMLWATLQQMPEDYREPLVLFHRGGQSVREIAVALGISEDAAKQRLSRGRAMLQDAVRAKVEVTLTRSRPTAAFTIAVLAGIPALTTSAQAATTGLAVAKGTGTLAATGLFSMLGGAFIGVAGAWLGMKCSLNRAESTRERRFIVLVALSSMVSVAVMIGAMMALVFWGAPLLASRPWLWIGLMAAVCFSFTASGLFFAVRNSRTQRFIRASERLKLGLAPEENDPGVIEYRSRLEFLGLPLVHVRYGGSPSTVAKGWIAYGPVAIAPLVACGGVAVGGIAMGAMSVGLITTAGIGIGLFSFSGLAVGGVVMGGLAAGWIAFGGAAWGWLAAYGGQAWAGVYGMGHHVIAPHANDAVARAFFADHGLMRMMDGIAQHGIWLQGILFLPMFALLTWINRRARRTKP